MSTAQIVVAAGIVLALAAAAWAARTAYLSPVAPALTSQLRPFDVFSPSLRGAGEPQVVTVFGSFIIFVILMYMVLDRGFAWFHVPGTPLFVGEATIAFGVFAILSSKVRVMRAVRKSPPLKLLLIFMAWGGALLLAGVPRWGLDAIRDSAIWYYGVAALFATFLLISDPTRLRKWVDLFARVVPILLIWFMAATFLTTVLPEDFFLVPDSTVSILDRKPGNFAVLAGIIIAFLWMVDAERGRFTSRQRMVLTGLGFLVIMITGAQNRGGMVAAAVGLMLMLFLMRRRRSEIILLIVGIAVAGTALLLVSGISIEMGNGRELSAEQFTQNFTSIINPDEGGQRQTHTTEWRLEIWTKVLDDVTSEHPITGFGPGPDLGERYGVSGPDPDAPLRNPHNSHIGVLARLGFVGLGLWVVMWLVWALHLLDHRAWLRRSGGFAKEHGLAGWFLVAAVTITTNAIFDPTLEGPQVSMILWFLFGVGAMLPILHSPLVAERYASDAAHTAGTTVPA